MLSYLIKYVPARQVDMVARTQLPPPSCTHVESSNQRSLARGQHLSRPTVIGYVMVATLCARKTQPRIGGTVTIRHVDAPIIIGLVELAGGRIAAKEGSKA